MYGSTARETLARGRGNEKFRERTNHSASFLNGGHEAGLLRLVAAQPQRALGPFFGRARQITKPPTANSGSHRSNRSSRGGKHVC